MRAGQALPTWSGLRRGLRFRFYTLALILDVAVTGLGRLAAWIAGDGWPQ